MNVRQRTERIARALHKFAEERSPVPWILGISRAAWGWSFYLQPAGAFEGVYARIRISDHGAAHHDRRYEVNVFKYGHEAVLGPGVLTLTEEIRRAKETILQIIDNMSG